MPRPHLYLLVSLLVAFGISYFSDHIDPYHLDVLTGIGINVILAVSLNLVNGFTGQFSLGHAGFMAVGAYIAASVSLFLTPQLPLGFLGREGAEIVKFLIAILMAGGAASLMGIFVGVP